METGSVSIRYKAIFYFQMNTARWLSKRTIDWLLRYKRFESQKKNQLLKVASFRYVNCGIVVQRCGENRRWTERAERRDKRDRERELEIKGRERKEERRDIKSFFI